MLPLLQASELWLQASCLVRASKVFVLGDYKTLSAFLVQGAHNARAANLNLWGVQEP